MAKLRTCRLIIKVPAELALMSPQDLEAYVRTHWGEWQGQWVAVGCPHGPDEMLRLDAGQPLYLVQRGATHYLVANATPMHFDKAA
jgi:hypothetical protein